MASDGLSNAFLAQPAYASAVRSPLQFFKLDLQERVKAEMQLARTGAVDITDYVRINSHLLDQKRHAITKLQWFVGRQPEGAESDVLHQWISRRQAEVALVEAAIALHDPQGDPAAASAAFNQACNELFGPYDTAQFFHHMQLLIDTVHDKTTPEWDYLASQLPLAAIATQAKAAHEPAADDVAYYQELGQQEFARVSDVVLGRVADGQELHDSSLLQDMITDLLHDIGAIEHGWKAMQSTETTKIAVNYAQKVIYIRKGKFRMLPYRLCGLLAHEVYVHVRRKLTTTPAQQLAMQCSVHDHAFEEGLGVFAEQVFLPHFRHLRQFRYVAIGLAKGTAGTPRSFAEVYEIMWRLKFLTQKTGTQETARHYAFDETGRVFRGVPFGVKGVAFTKDKLYIEGNAAVWAHLANRLAPQNFADFLLKR